MAPKRRAAVVKRPAAAQRRVKDSTGKRVRSRSESGVSGYTKQRFAEQRCKLLETHNARLRRSNSQLLVELQKLQDQLREFNKQYQEDVGELNKQIRDLMDDKDALRTMLCRARNRVMDWDNVDARHPGGLLGRGEGQP